MHAELQAIIAADLATRRDIEAVTQRLAARHEAERARLEAARDAAAAEGRARLEADLRAAESEGRARIEARRAASAALRARRRRLADAATASAIAAYVRVLRGHGGGGAGP